MTIHSISRAQISLTFCFLLLALVPTTDAQPRFDTDPVWPLCGNLYLEAPSDDPYDPYDAFVNATACPSARRGADFADLVQSPFGPRHLKSVLEYDWHRGLDLPTRQNGSSAELSRRPVYAMTDGVVLRCEKSDPNGSGRIPCTMADSETTCLLNPGNATCDNFPDIRLLIEHERPGNIDRCAPEGCYYTRYVHLSRVLPAFVNPSSTPVTKGQFLGLTGHSETGTFNHLHFEVRSSIHAETDISQREAIDPLKVLPYHGTPTAPCADDPASSCDPSLKVAFELPDTGPVNPFGIAPVNLSGAPPTVTVRATVDPTAGPTTTDETDLARIEIRISELQLSSHFGGAELVPIPQGSQTPKTPENEDWILDPSYLDHELLNRQYTYKHEGTLGVSWIDYGTSTQQRIQIGDFSSGTYTSPFSTMPNFPTSWSDSAADFHLTATLNPNATPEESIGDFNGLWIWPSRYTGASSIQETYVQFRSLDLGNGGPLCVEAFTYDVQGNRSPEPARFGPCAPSAPAAATLSDTMLGLRVSWSGVHEASFYRVWSFDSSTGDARRGSLVRELTGTHLLLGRPKANVGFAVEACYASAPSCSNGAAGETCSIAQCSPIVEAGRP